MDPTDFSKFLRRCRPLPGELRKAGYLAVSVGKNRDYSSFPWDDMPEVGGDRNWYGRRPQTLADEVRKAVR